MRKDKSQVWQCKQSSGPTRHKRTFGIVTRAVVIRLLRNPGPIDRSSIRDSSKYPATKLKRGTRYKIQTPSSTFNHTQPSEVFISPTSYATWIQPLSSCSFEQQDGEPMHLVFQLGIGWLEFDSSWWQNHFHNTESSDRGEHCGASPWLSSTPPCWNDRKRIHHLSTHLFDRKQWLGWKIMIYQEEEVTGFLPNPNRY
jgi:hypothetical protein